MWVNQTARSLSAHPYEYSKTHDKRALRERKTSGETATLSRCQNKHKPAFRALSPEVKVEKQGRLFRQWVDYSEFRQEVKIAEKGTAVGHSWASFGTCLCRGSIHLHMETYALPVDLE